MIIGNNNLIGKLNNVLIPSAHHTSHDHAHDEKDAVPGGVLWSLFCYLNKKHYYRSSTVLLLIILQTLKNINILIFYILSLLISNKLINTYFTGISLLTGNTQK